MGGLWLYRLAGAVALMVCVSITGCGGGNGGGNGSVVARIAISTSGKLTVNKNGTVTLTATAFDALDKAVTVKGSDCIWSKADANGALSLAANGDKVTVTGAKDGQGTVKLTYSGFTAEAVVTVATTTVELLADKMVIDRLRGLSRKSVSDRPGAVAHMATCANARRADVDQKRKRERIRSRLVHHAP